MKKFNKAIRDDRLSRALLSLFSYVPIKSNIGLKYLSNYYSCVESDVDKLMSLIEKYSAFEGECQLHSFNIVTKISKNHYDKIRDDIDKTNSFLKRDHIYYSYDSKIQHLNYKNAIQLGKSNVFSYSSVEVLNYRNLEFYLILKIAFKPDASNKVQNFDISYLKPKYLKLNSLNIFKWKEASLEEKNRMAIALYKLEHEFNDIYLSGIHEFKRITKKLGLKIPRDSLLSTSLIVTRRENTPYIIYQGDEKLKLDTESNQRAAYKRKDETCSPKPDFYCKAIHDVDAEYFKTRFDQITIVNDPQNNYYSSNTLPHLDWGIFSSNIDNLILTDIRKRLKSIYEILRNSDLLELNKIEEKRKLLSKAILKIDRLQTEINVFIGTLHEAQYLRSNRDGRYETTCVNAEQTKDDLKEIKTSIHEKSSILSDEISIKNISTQRRLSIMVFLLAMVQVFSPVFEDSLKQFGSDFDLNLMVSYLKELANQLECFKN
ncbi:hypothetical protein [Vibrio diabolicus]|uniref:hypothetical protein n=1 Tax=Vibrio diabolicus TaxID=50719 RepID=UPI00374FF1AE